MTTVTLTQEGTTLIAKISGEIDHHWAQVLRQKIDLRIVTTTPKTVVLDFANVTFMDSSGIGLILGRHKLIEPLGGVVTVQNAPTGIKRMLALAGIACINEKEKA